MKERNSTRGRLLLTENSARPDSGVRSALQSEGYGVDVAVDAHAVALLAGLHPYDAILLDVSLPSLGDPELVQQLRRAHITVPVLVLSASREVEDRVRRLDAGADDYVQVPFSMAELLARLRALLRRHRRQAPQLLCVADLTLDRVTRHAMRAGRRIELTRREFALLELLMSASPQPVSKAGIIAKVWPQTANPKSNVVNVYVNNLRRKVHRENLPPLIHTVRGVGFSCRDFF